MWTRLAHSRATRRFPIWAFLFSDLGFLDLGFLVNSETRHTEGANNQIPIWATLLTVKRDTGGANNQISEKLRELKR